MDRTYFFKMGILFFVFFWLRSGFGKDNAREEETFWETKDYLKWTDSDIRKLLEDSPWAQRKWVQTFENIPPSEPLSREDIILQGGEYIPHIAGGENSITMDIRWYSSSTIRKALSRFSYYARRFSEKQLKELVELSPEYFLIAIVSTPGSLFNAVNFEMIKTDTFLLSKNNPQKKIELINYIPPKRRKDQYALFFPRFKDGKSNIDLSDGRILFLSEMRRVKITASFDLEKMKINGELDI